MKIGILGSGNIGGALGRLWTQAGHDVFFSSRHPERLNDLISQTGGSAKAGTQAEAIAFSDLLLEAIPYKFALQLPADDLGGKTLLSASNYYPSRDGEIDLQGLSHTELLARKLPRTKLVKVFNMMFAEEMAARADGNELPELAIFLAGDDAEARAVAAQLVRDAKFTPIDAGRLAHGRHFESDDAPLYAERFSPEEARSQLDRCLERGA